MIYKNTRRYNTTLKKNGWPFKIFSGKQSQTSSHQTNPNAVQICVLFSLAVNLTHEKGQQIHNLV